MTSHDHRPEPVHGEQPASEHHPRSAEHWEERYAGEQMWSGDPNGALVAEVAHLTPGRALDIGCGEGADSVWLAQQGWEVTALDIAQNAVNRTLAAAQEAGVTVRGVVAPFDEAHLPAGSFELVSAMYPVVWKSAERTVERRLFDLVAPGGTLLFVHHDMDEIHPEDEHGSHEHDPSEHGPNDVDFSEILMPADVRAALPTGWTVVTDGSRARHVAAGSGAGHTTDLILRVQRQG